LIGGAFQLVAAISGITSFVSYIIVTSVFIVPTGVLAIVGGAYAIQRKKWILALAACVFAFFPLSFWLWVIEAEFYWPVVLSAFLGIGAIVLTVLSKKEFERK